MALLKCKMCGGNLEVEGGNTLATCDSCGSTMTVPKDSDERKANLFNRANHLRRNNDFDKALQAYENILNEDNSEAEAHWGVVLCKYGIEYVEDPQSGKRLPTCHRTQYDSVLLDADYKQTLEYADGYAKEVYEEEAKLIDQLQKDILAISSKEEPFDVFICYKETSESGQRTKDSVLAQDIYFHLQDAGLKVFFARVTLEDKLGSAYEPYIFAALNSAKVMVVVGTQPEYLNAVWTKNEWSRFLSFAKKDKKKVLIPAYRGMDAYELPEEFSHLQALDMGKIGFIQDLTRGILKVTKDGEKPVNARPSAVDQNGGGNPTVESLLDRAFFCLEDEDNRKADELFEQALNLDPRSARAYLGKILLEYGCKRVEELRDLKDPIDPSKNYLRAVSFGDASIESILTGANQWIIDRNEEDRKEAIYAKCVNIIKTSQDPDSVEKALTELRTIQGYKDSAETLEKYSEQPKELVYNRLVQQMEEAGVDRKGLERIITQFGGIQGYKDVEQQIEKCKNKITLLDLEADKQKVISLNNSKLVLSALLAITLAVIVIQTYVIPQAKYSKATDLIGLGRYDEAATIIFEIIDYKDSRDMIGEIALNSIKNNEIPPLAALRVCRISACKNLRNLSIINAGSEHTVGLNSDGTAVADGNNNFGQINVDGWSDILAVSAGYSHTVGLKSAGTVVAVGNNTSGQLNVDGWSDIVAVSAGTTHTVGQKSDGTVVATGSNSSGQLNVDGWRDIVAVSAGFSHTVGLRSDGTVVAVGWNEHGQLNVNGWNDIVAVSAGGYHTVGLRSDGTVVAVGNNDYGQLNVNGWNDIVAVTTGLNHTVGLRSDGTVVAVGNNYSGQLKVVGWNDIVAVSAGENHTVGLRSDGTVVATGNNDYGLLKVVGWKHIGYPDAVFDFINR